MTATPMSRSSTAVSMRALTGRAGDLQDGRREPEAVAESVPVAGWRPTSPPDLSRCSTWTVPPTSKSSAHPALRQPVLTVLGSEPRVESCDGSNPSRTT